MEKYKKKKSKSFKTGYPVMSSDLDFGRTARTDKTDINKTGKMVAPMRWGLSW